MTASRRRLLRMSAALGGALTACKKSTAPSADAEPSRLGKPPSGYGDRSPYVKSLRKFRVSKSPENGSSATPLAECYGIITPAGLHFERHHAGVPALKPEEHRLLIHGLVERPLVFTMADIQRLPSVSKIYFVECSGNTGSEWAKKTATTVQRSHGLASCSEWTGVPLPLLLAEAGLKKEATWLIAEGADACKMVRSIPVKKALDDILVAYGQNGEPIRPEQGFPLRLIVPGWEGNINVKWLRRIKAVDGPMMARDETSHYTDLMPDGTARQFTFLMEAKSVITFPSGEQKLGGAGFYEITGLAWSGRGRIERVEVSTDGGKRWQGAQLQEPRLSLAFTRFRLPWRWDGKETVIASRCTDESGYVQPSKEALIEARGVNSQYHNNAIKPWKILPDGSVTSADG